MADTPDTDAIIRAALDGIDAGEMERRRDEILGATLPVITAARDYVNRVGTPGVVSRMDTLRASLDHLRATDSISAVIIAAALWADGSDRIGAAELMVDLQEAVDALR